MNTSKIRVSLLLTALCLAFAAPAVLASGTSYPAPAAVPNAQTDPLLVTKSMKCRVIEVGEAGQVKIQNPKTEEISWIKVTEDTKLRAQDRKAFDGRKKLEVTDIQVGQVLRINHRPATGEVLKIKVLRQRKS